MRPESIRPEFQMSPSTAAAPTAAYIHIPFCRRRCFYCDFPVSVVGDQRHGGNSLAIARYVEALGDEIHWTAASIGSVPKDGGLRTVFFGGGTPSLLTAAQVAQILAMLRSQIGIADQAEISMEMDPGTFDLDQLQGYRAAGINRVSLGSQAFQDRLLAACGRTHRVAEIHAAVALLRQAGISNFSLDLISGLPTQTLADWQESLENAIAIAPPHLSAYDMVLEPGTVFGKRYEPGDQPLPTDQAAAQMYRLAQARLTAAGYGHYEVSNYAQPGFQCRHNRVYWERRPYYAFGMGAASFVGNWRLTRPRTTRLYYEWLASARQSLGAAQVPEQVFGDRISPTDALLETLMLGMRLVEGVDLLVLQRCFGREVVEAIASTIQPFVVQQWVQPLGQSAGSRLQFTDPEGFLFSNQVLAALFEALEGKHLQGIAWPTNKNNT